MKNLTFKMVEPYINENINEYKYVIHCDTEEKAKELFSVCGIDLNTHHWYAYREDTCYNLYHFNNKIDFGYANKNYYCDSIITEFDDLFKKKENNMKNFDWDEFIQGNVAVHCDTKEKAKDFLIECDNNEMTWCNGDNLLDNDNCWDVYKENTCYEFDDEDGICYSNTYYYKKEKYKIIEWEIEKNINNYKFGKGYIEINGNRVELTKEQIEILCGNDNPYGYKNNDKFYCSSSKFITTCEQFTEKYDKNWYIVGNYCRDKELKEQDTLHDLLKSKLRQFSMLNGGLDIDWNEYNNKYFIYKKGNEYNITWNTHNKKNDIYFIDNITAQRAIDEIIIPFEKEHPNFVW